MSKELIYKDDLVKKALSFFEANHRLVTDNPNTYPHVINYRGYFDPSRDCAVVEYEVDNGQQTEEKACLYWREDFGL